MEPFVKSESGSAGYQALDSLFPSTPAPAAASAPASRGASRAEPKPDAAATSHEDAQPSDPGDHGRLGDVPGADGSQADPASSTEAPAAEANWFEFSATDDQGRRKFKVDLNDKEKLARILPQAQGFRKMQTERDAATAKLKAVEPELADLRTQWQTLESTFQQSGIEGLVDLLQGKKGAFTEWRSQEVERDSRYKAASQAEKDRMDLDAKVTRLEAEAKRREASATKASEEASRQREATELSTLEGQLVPAFNKHRFAGTLGKGREAQEAAFDQAIWDQAIRNLEQVPEGTPLTAQAIDAEFKKVATAFRGAIGREARTQARAATDKNKQAAQTQVAAAAARAMRPSSDMGRMEANVRRGGIGGLTDGLVDVLRMGRGK